MRPDFTCFLLFLLQGLIIALLALALQAIVIYRQQHKRLLSRTSAPPRGIVFPDANPKNWDTNLINMIKFFFNYGFYKFGFEVFILSNFNSITNK